MLVTFLILCPLPLYDAVLPRVALWRTGSEREHGGSSKNHQIWIQRLFHAWVILAAVLVKAHVYVSDIMSSVRTKPLF